MLVTFLSLLIAFILFDGGKGLFLGALLLIGYQVVFFKKNPNTQALFMEKIAASKALLICGLVFFTYFTFSSLWSLSPSASLLKGLQLLMLYLGGIFCLLTPYSHKQKTLTFLSPLLFRAFIFLFILLLIEVLLRFFNGSLFHLWHPLSQNQRFGLITKSGLFLVLFFWPSFFYLSFLNKKPFFQNLFHPPFQILASKAATSWRWTAFGALILFCLGLCFDMDVILLSLALSFFVFSFSLIFTRSLPYILSLTFWLLAFLPLLINPFVSLIVSSPLLKFIPISWQHRFYIWQYVTELIAKKPLLGWGLEASRLFSHRPLTLSFFTPTGVSVLHGSDILLPLHPHNGFLQLWLEGGFVGVILFLIFISFLLHRLFKTVVTPLKKAFIGASFVGCLVPFCLSYGLWQSWWLVTLFTLAWYWILLLKISSSAS